MSHSNEGPGVGAALGKLCKYRPSQRLDNADTILSNISRGLGVAAVCFNYVLGQLLSLPNCREWNYTWG